MNHRYLMRPGPAPSLSAGFTNHSTQCPALATSQISASKTAVICMASTLPACSPASSPPWRHAHAHAHHHHAPQRACRPCPRRLLEHAASGCTCIAPSATTPCSWASRGTTSTGRSHATLFRTIAATCMLSSSSCSTSSSITDCTISQHDRLAASSISQHSRVAASSSASRSRSARIMQPAASGAAGSSRHTHAGTVHQAGSITEHASNEACMHAADATDIHFMHAALEQAHAAAAAGEVPVGAVVVLDGQVVASAHNLTHGSADPTAHAELLAIQAAARSQGAWRLPSATLYCTLEPCPMCAGAVLQARLGRVVYGAVQPRLGAAGSWVALLPGPLQPGHRQQGSGQQEREGPGQGHVLRRLRGLQYEGRRQQQAGAIAAMLDRQDGQAQGRPRQQSKRRPQQWRPIRPRVWQALGRASTAAAAAAVAHEIGMEEEMERPGQEEMVGPAASAGGAGSPVCVGAVHAGKAETNACGLEAAGSALSDAFETSAHDVDAGDGGGGSGSSGGWDDVIIPHGPHPFHPGMEVVGGVLQAECAAVVKAFFKQRRQGVANVADTTSGAGGRETGDVL